MNWIPKFIHRVFDYKSHQTLSAKEMNAILNLLVAQGDYNSEWLQYLTEEGIPDAIAKMSAEQIEQALTKAVAKELEALASSVVNKTSAYLNKPLFTFLDTSIQKDMLQFRELLESKGTIGTLTANVAFTGASSAYPTVQQLQVAQLAGFDILTCGNTASALTPDNAYESASLSLKWAQDNEIIAGQRVFVYPEGNTLDVVETEVSRVFSYMINTKLEQGYIDSDEFFPKRICVISLDDSHTVHDSDIQELITETLAHNYWCIFKVDSGAQNYSEILFSECVDFVLAQSGVEVVTVTQAIDQIETTINNLIDDLFDLINNTDSGLNRRLDDIDKSSKLRDKEIKETVLSNVYIDYKNESGEETDEKYIHW